MLLLPMLALGAREAAAAEYCVGTVAEFDAAMNVADSDAAASETTVIRLKTGTYDMSTSDLFNQRGGNSYHALQWLGGHNADCSERTLAPANTVLDANGYTFQGVGMNGDLLVEGLTFEGFGGYHELTFVTQAPNVELDLYNNVLQGVRIFLVASDYYASADGTSAHIRNNLVTGNVNNVPAGSIYAAGFQSAVGLTSNTVSGNAVNGISLCSNAGVVLKDNIAWNNSGYDINVYDCGSDAPTDVELHANLFGTIHANVTNAGSADSLGSDPLFVNAATGNYRLQNASPAINSGYLTSSLTGVDLDGNARVVGSTVDRGAYESSIDDTIPTTITVTNANDSGAGSLRQAILDANNNADFTFINFNIPGTCPIEIAPDTADLPAITHGVRIDGFSQPGSAANTHTKGDNATRCIILSGKYGRKYGFHFNAGATDQFWLQGLAFSYFSPSTSPGNGVAVRLSDGKDSIIWGNQFGGTLKTPTGTQSLSASDTNILLTNLSAGTSVGGSAPVQRNVIAAAKGDGVLVTSFTGGGFTFSSNNNDIVGNLIGSDRSESSAAGNHVGVHVTTSGNTVSGNVIINSGQDGVLLEGTGAYNNAIEDNRIGVTDLFCSSLLCFETAAGNGRDGIMLFYGPHDNIVYQNRIHSNTSRGIEIGSSSGAVSARNWLIANSLYSNGAQGTMFNVYNGADNDANAAAADMANRGLNYPVITRAYGGTKKGVVEGTLSTTNGSYAIDVFSSAQPDSGYPRGEGDLYHRSYYSVTINNAASGQNGSKAFSIPFTSTLSLASRVITLTAADTADGNTSELSAPVTYLCDVIFAHGFEDAAGDKCP